MAAVYKTPGVYIEEIPKLPPSVAQVETAIPAFIGYTEKADNISPGDLLNRPKRIGALVEYELYYGGGPAPSITEVQIDNNNNFISAKLTNNFFLYDSLRMFYANGGGDCYIVSAGIYPPSLADTDFTKALDEIYKVDEPTILLFPDAVSLTDDKFTNVQTAALKQAAELQDRVALLDLKQTDAYGVTFRNTIGINYLSYGAAYTPWLKVSLQKTIRYTNIKSVIQRSGISVQLSGLTTETKIIDQINDLEKAYADKQQVISSTIALSPPNGNLWDKFNTLEAAFNTTNSDTNLQHIFSYIYNIAIQVDNYINIKSPLLPDLLKYSKLKDDITATVVSTFAPLYKKIVALEAETDIAISSYAAVSGAELATLTTASWPDVVGATPSTILTGTTEEEKRKSALNSLKVMFDNINRAYVSTIISAATTYTNALDDSLAISFPAYKGIISGVSNSMTAMPPSGAVAGVYAAVDRTRGVWKAPGNVSLANVVAPDVIFRTSELDALNVDPVAGKSINAIRYFTGKGTLIFGARTLAGNDNEWRYISVRRFFNMVEESSKKSTELFVFEPNDANTWVKVQGMLENFLTTLWRQGALQGAKPEHAFYVAVGLGKTMTSLDILEGRMIVEIGMAVVRPAEFIILRFSHKLAES
jgi:phage tail sheath protein FI